MIASFGRRVGDPEAPETGFEDIVAVLANTATMSSNPVSGASGSPTRRPNEAIILGSRAAPKSYRARVGIDLCSNFNEVAFRVTHHRFVVSVSSYPRTSSYGHSGCAHGSY